ncbi:hypothetical protein A4H97_04665 [Niastella yeongjuensis]|uniref:Alginate lyase domain-containing protein n=2 Tax=Niastella yeongjuensis TaxID=354355 RepID=A0A1V9EKZ2_9BACT|nr:hypothetical protein A4H97_04665 [Niastella yeongjuensis]
MIASFRAKGQNDTSTYGKTFTLGKAHPFLLLTEEQVVSIRKSLKTTPWKGACWELLKEDANKYLSQKIEIPNRGGNWDHYYVNPVTGSPLSRGKLVGNWKWQHIDKVTGQVFSGDTSLPEKDYDGVIVGLIHNAWALGVLELGLAYQISEKPVYAQKAMDILLYYAKLYPKLPIRNRKTENFSAVGSGKIHVQDLDESQWLVSMIQGADLVWNTLSSQEQDTITNQLLLPAAAVIKKRRAEISNIQCWKIAAMGMVGLFTGEQKYFNAATVDSLGGIGAQITKGFNKEGINLDLSPSYQDFSLQPLVLLTTALQNCGYNTIPSLQKMFETPILMSTPGLSLPAFNDSKPINLRYLAYLYEWAYTHYKSPIFSEVLTRSNRGRYQNIGSSYRGWSLLFGSEELLQAPQRTTGNKNFEKSGIALLSIGKGDSSLSCYFKYTNQLKKRVHFQNAQLDFGILKGNKQIAIIPGNASYASRLSDGWYRHGLGHNSFIFNEKEQKRSSGQCLAFGESKGVSYAVAETTNAYDSVRFVRCIAVLDENTVLIVDQFRSGRKDSTLFDIAYHQAGVWDNEKRGKDWKAPNANGYAYVANTKIIKKQNQIELSTRLGAEGKVSLSGTTTVQMDIITGYGRPFEGLDVPAAIFRINASEGALAYCISTKGEKFKVELTRLPSTDKEDSLRGYRIMAIVKNSEGKRTGITIAPYSMDKNAKVSIEYADDKTAQYDPKQ